MDIYKSDGNPVWLWSEMTNMTEWPTPSWSRNDVGYRTAKYNMATTAECSTKDACIFETRWGLDAPYNSKPYGRQYHDADNAVVSLVLNVTTATTPNTPIDIAWPPAGWPPIPPGSNVSGCDFPGTDCRPIYKHTDKETLWVLKPVCDVLTVGGTCNIYVSWTASPLAIIERIDPATGLRKPHGLDGGIVGGGILGDNFADTLAADEQVIYRLNVGDRIGVVTRGARAALSTISATHPCIVAAGQTTCATTVTWWTPDAPPVPTCAATLPPSLIYVFRNEQVGAGAPVRTPFASQKACGSQVDTVRQGTKVWYTVTRNPTGILASTESNPVIPVSATITALPTQCSIAVGQTTCAIGLTWVAGTTDKVYRVLDNNTAALVTACTASPCTDNLPSGSHVRYVVKNTSGVELARSSDVAALTSTLTAALISNTSTIAVDWSSVPGAVIDRVTETASNAHLRLPANFGAGFGHYVDAPAASARVHYELMVSGVVHAVTAAVTVPAALPTVTFTPTSGAVGIPVRLIGTGFSSSIAANVVKFHGTVATITAATATSLDTTVPAGATSGTVSVTVNGQTGTSAGAFTVLVPSPPSFTFTPTQGYQTNAVTLLGTGFSSTISANVVKFNGTVATVTAVTPTSLNTTVPIGATSGTVSVTASGLTGTSSSAFTVLVAPPLQPTAVNVPGASASASFAVTWTPSASPPAATLFKLQRASTPSGPWTVINNALPATPTSYGVTVPTSGTYYYQVAACIGTAACSAFTTSAGVHVTITSVAGEIFYFHHTNMQGSVVATTDAQGYVIAASQFRSFGSRLNRPVTGATGPANVPMNQLGFTGKWHDDELQLDYFGARHYDSVTGRFISIDPAGFSEGNLQSFNRYAYANNNPYRYIDPDGRQSIPALLAIVPGQQAWENARGSWNAGNYSDAALHTSAMLGEQVVTVASFGQGAFLGRSLSAAESFVSQAATKSAAREPLNKPSIASSLDLS
ncbi:MAG: RHS repeat-associated core domain-containing protein [Dokdonella sp.]